MYLRLRGIGNMGEGSMDDMKGTRVTLIESSSSRLMKRSRTPGSGAQVPLCMVDGCSSDLSKCRDYHRRHKVCELHSKTPKVTICGQEQRFCQQCSRFHSLVEFDDRKRSCRKRLDGHNRRRRKPQPATMTLNAGRFLYGNQSPRFLPFGNQLLSASNDGSSSWIGTIKPENNAALCGSNSQFNFADRRKSMLPGSLACDYKEKQLAISCIPIGVLPKSSDTQPFLNVGSSNGGNVQKVLGNGSNRFFDSDCALSLLSTPVEPGEINNLSSMVQSNLIPSAHFIHSDGLGLESDLVNSGLVLDGSSDANIRSYSTFQDGPDHGSSIDLFRF